MGKGPLQKLLHTVWDSQWGGQINGNITEFWKKEKAAKGYKSDALKFLKKNITVTFGS